MAKYYEQNRKRQPKQLAEMSKLHCVKLNVLFAAAADQGIKIIPSITTAIDTNTKIEHTHVFAEIIDGPKQTKTKNSTTETTTMGQDKT